jgi:hypothetical protein
VVCEPDRREAPRAVPRAAAGSTLVVSLTGEAAARALELTRGDGGTAFLSASPVRTGQTAPGPAAGSSRGPTYALAPKPDLAAAGTAVTARPGRAWALVSGTSVAAARVGAAAVDLHRRLPQAPPAELAGRLVGTARARGPLVAAGAGTVAVSDAARAPAWAEPPAIGLRRVSGRGGLARGRTFVRRPGGATGHLPASAEVDQAGVLAVVRTSGAAGYEVELRGAPQLPRAVSGRLRLRGISPAITIPFILAAEAPRPRLGPLRLTGRRGRRGVRFALGAARRGPEGVRVEPVGSLVLELQRGAGTRVRELTPPGGSIDLLPGEYAFALTREDLSSLPAGSYRFVAWARGPSGGRAVKRRSLAFAAP